MKKNIVSGRSGALVLALVVASLIGLTLPAVAVPPSSGSRQYSASMTPTNATGGVSTTFAVTITNQSASSAVLGSANLTLPSDFTAVGSPTITFSSGKAWTASKTGTTTITIRLRAVGDTQKLSPGQSVTVQFTATLSCNDSPRTVTILTAAKASRDFTGSSSFTRVGPNPSVNVSGCGFVECPDAPVECTGTVGDTDDAPAGQQTGRVDYQGDGCGGCSLTVIPTDGDFCTVPSSTQGLPKDCQSPLVVKFKFGSPYTGTARVTVTCDKDDCPPPTEGSDFYPLYFTESNGPTTGSDEVLKIDQLCSTETITIESVTSACIESFERLGNGDYRTIVSIEFFEGGDPRTGY